MTKMINIDPEVQKDMDRRQRHFDNLEIERLCTYSKGRGSMQAIILQSKFGLGDYVEGELDGQYQRGEHYQG